MLATRQSARRNAKMDPDVDLMLRVREGDECAFEELVSRHRANVRQQLFMMMGDRDDAEDLAQEVFLRIYRHRLSYRPEAKFVTWLYHIVRNVGRNALRSRRRRPTLPLGVVPELDREQPLPDAKAEAPSRRLDRHELGAVVRQAMATLQRRQRDALFLQQFEDRSYDEIAHRLALTPKAAKSLLYRARNQMREALSPYVLEAAV